MATPLTGPGPNKIPKPKVAGYGPIGKGGKTPLTKKISIPLPTRKPDGTLRLGNGG